MRALGVVAVVLVVACGSEDSDDTRSSSRNAGLGANAATVTSSSSGESSTGVGSVSSSSSGEAVSASTSSTASDTSSAQASVATSTSSASSSTGGALEGPPARQAYLAAAGAYEIPPVTSSLMVDAVYYASLLGTSGQGILTTGTLTQSAGGEVSYTNSPTDRLRILYNNGTSTEYFVQQIEGNFAYNSRDFMTHDHALDYRYVNTAVGDIDVVATRSGGTVSGSADGTLILEGTTYTLDTNRQGTVSAQVDGNFARTEFNESLTGTVTTTGGFSETLNEQRFSAYQIFNGESVNDISRTINNAWTRDGHAYQLTGGLIQKTFTDGVAAQLDSYWQANGDFLREGVSVGGLGWGVNGPAIEIWLDVDGARTILETFPAP